MSEINELYSLKELFEYERNINSLIESDSSDLVFNDSIVHAALIMSAILNKATNINMYCGKFSIFRNSFKDKLVEMFNNPMYKDDKESPQFKDFNPYEKITGALHSFFEKQGKMNVIMQQDVFSLKQEKIWYDFLEKFYQKGQINFYEYKGNANLYHFTVADNKMYRQESNSDLRTAFACFNNEDIATRLNICFDILKTNSSIANLN